MKILRILFLVIALSGISQMARGQVLIGLLFGDKLNSDKVEFGLVLGANQSTLFGLKHDKGLYTFSVGMYTNIKLGKEDKFTFNPRLFFRYVSGARHMSLALPAQYASSGLDSSAAQSQQVHYALPLAVNYWITHRFSMGLGPQVNLLYSATHIYTRDRGKERLEIQSRKQYNPFDAGITVNAYWKLSDSKSSMSLSVAYYAGLTNIIKHNTGNRVSNSVLQFLVGIPIGVKKSKTSP